MGPHRRSTWRSRALFIRTGALDTYLSDKDATRRAILPRARVPLWNVSHVSQVPDPGHVVTNPRMDRTVAQSIDKLYPLLSTYTAADGLDSVFFPPSAARKTHKGCLSMSPRPRPAPSVQAWRVD
jgi:hypothetical protein